MANNNTELPGVTFSSKPNVIVDDKPTYYAIQKSEWDYLKKELQYEREHLADLPLFNVESSIQFSYHTEAGIDGQCLELLPGDPLITLSAIRGAGKRWFILGIP